MTDMAPDASRAFGQRVLGPILAEFSMRLWAYLAAIKTPDDACVLFCARGGLRLQELFERFTDRTGLGSPVPVGTLMVSRLVAARTALARGAASALDELGREFEGATARQVAESLTQAKLPLGSRWDISFDRTGFLRLMAEEPDAAGVNAAIAEQNELFAEHLEQAAAGRRRLVLCDTGLYGSTIRLLLDGMPKFSWECVMIARANYKGFATDHYAKTTGLLVERDLYSPVDRRSVLLRYWHLFEWVLEPELPSVRLFHHDPSGVPRSNLEVPGWRDRVQPAGGGMFAGILDYFDGLSSGWVARNSQQDTDAAWNELRQILRFPRAQDAAMLRLSDRSQDFGRSSLWPVPSSKSVTALQIFKGMKRSLWREGEIAFNFRHTRPVILRGMETVHMARWVWHEIILRQSRG